jgi:predicted PolB exonuclease-like 3'-5' exonuclease
MDVLAGYQGRATVPLDQMAMMLGFPGKLGMHGSEVWNQFRAGHLKAIRDYCETDVLNTYLIYLKFEFMRGHLTASALAEEFQRVRSFLGGHDAEHFAAFLAAWDAPHGG